MNDNEKLVCVTGASGFVAAHLVAALLQDGYRVRGTVRSLAIPEKYRYLTELPGADERLELVEAELLTEGSYDEAVAGCGAVFHTASPYVINVKDPQKDLVDPAVKGTLNVLGSCRKAGGVARVILTSSMAAITDEPRDDHVFTEEDWNEASSLKRNPYYYSKVLAEKAAWDFSEEDGVGFELVVINPFMIIGPSLSPGLNSSNKILVDLLTGTYPGILSLNWGFVDVRDVARAHIRALETPKAKGRYLCAGEVLTMKELVDHLRDIGAGEGRKLPSMGLSSGFSTGLVKMLSYAQPRGVGSYLRSHLGKTMRYDNSKIREELGQTFISARDSASATIADLEKWGHLEPVGAA